MAFRQGQANFSKGELAPALFGRTDIAPYAAGVRRARNVVIMKYGGLTSRPGTEFIAEALDASQPVKLIPFQFDEGKSGQNYALEMGQGYMRLAANGGMVVEKPLAIVSMTNTNPVRVTIPFHGYAVGDMWFVSGVLGMTEVNGRSFRVVDVINANQFAIALDGTGLGVFTGDGPGGATNTAPPDPLPPDPVVPPAVDPDPPATVGGGGGGGGIRNQNGHGTVIP